MSSQPDRQNADAVPLTKKLTSSPHRADATTRSALSNSNEYRDRPPIKRGVAYVLWGDGFDELMGVRLLAALRTLAIQSFLVGFRHQSMRGAHGITLVPNLALDEALVAVHDARWLIVPAQGTSHQPFIAEPRLGKLLTLLARQPTTVIVGQERLVDGLQQLLTSSPGQLQFQVYNGQMGEARLLRWLSEIIKKQDDKGKR